MVQILIEVTPNYSGTVRWQYCTEQSICQIVIIFKKPMQQAAMMAMGLEILGYFRAFYRYESDLSNHLNQSFCAHIYIKIELNLLG